MLSLVPLGPTQLHHFASPSRVPCHFLLQALLYGAGDRTITHCSTGQWAVSGYFLRRPKFQLETSNEIG